MGTVFFFPGVKRPERGKTTHHLALRLRMSGAYTSESRTCVHGVYRGRYISVMTGSRSCYSLLEQLELDYWCKCCGSLKEYIIIAFMDLNHRVTGR